MMIQHADIWCSSLDLEHFTTVFFITTLNLTGKSRCNLIMLRSGSFQYSANISNLDFFFLLLLRFFHLFFNFVNLNGTCGSWKVTQRDMGELSSRWRCQRRPYISTVIGFRA